MKKTKYYAWMMAAALAMAGCSDEIETGGENGGATIDGETGYIKVALNLPSTSGMSTRAANDDFNDGVPAEYKVNDVYVAFFYGTSESDATCEYAIKIDNPSISDDVDDDNVTRYVVGVEGIPKPTNNVYALAIINGSKIFSVSNEQLTINGTAFEGKLEELNGTAESVKAGKTLTDITSIASTTGEGNFLMLNAPLANQGTFTSKPENLAVNTLVKLTVHQDESDAEGATVTDEIYVERAVAKATLTVGSGNSFDINDTEFPAATAKVLGWRLQNTNKKWYYVRNVSAWDTWAGYFVNSGNNRFIGTSWTSGSNTYARTYWAIDPNYSTSITGDDLAGNFNIIGETQIQNESFQWNGITTDDSEVAEYCLENTTTAALMNETQLTSFEIKVEWTLDGGNPGDNLFMIQNQSAIYSEKEFLDNLTATLTNEGHALEADESLAIKAAAVEGFFTTTDGIKSLVKITRTKGDKDLSDEQLADILSYVNSDIKYYKGGVMYYYTPLIQHFGNDLTPYTGDTHDVKYSEQEHLGRYGVVRNNWYEMNITGITGPGEPVPVIPDKPADKEDSYIKCQINILSWAKRTQDVVLTN